MKTIFSIWNNTKEEYQTVNEFDTDIVFIPKTKIVIFNKIDFRNTNYSIKNVTIEYLTKPIQYVYLDFICFVLERMNKDQIFENVVDIVNNVCPGYEHVTMNTTIGDTKDIYADCFDLAEIFMYIENEFNITISDKDSTKDSYRIEEIVDFVYKKVMKRILEPFDINKAKSGARVETGFGLKVDIVSYNYRSNKGHIMIRIAHQTHVDAIHYYNQLGVDITAPSALNNLFIVKYSKERSVKDISNSFKKLLQIKLYPKYGYLPTVDEIPKSDILFAVGRVNNELRVVPVNGKYARFLFLTENSAKQFLSDNEKLLKVFFELD